ncbi:MAG: FGGY family carbohydrate kinase, partial [Rhodococcus sp. (in: high G+C Gram-positive bacteria)]
MALVAGIDSSTQSCKVFVRDADSGELVRSGRAGHPDGTEIDPARWKSALDNAIADAGGLDDVAAVAVGAQQHGMICLDESGAVVRPALLWNDTRSAQSAADLVDELGGGQAWADAIGVVPLASITVSKLRWLADNEPGNADRAAAVCLPHDWLSWHLGGASGFDSLATDRGDASGTGYFSAATGRYREDLLESALRGRTPRLPRVAGPSERIGETPWGAAIGPGTG